MIDLLPPMSIPAPPRAPRAARPGQDEQGEAAGRELPERHDPEWEDVDRPAPRLGLALLLSLMLWLVLGLVLGLALAWVIH